ncbi:unnamed protein product [Arctia plantaginis]|uniref:Sperm-associated antigen 17 n=1 Tax=Arctia plantaginis TaxID=874455 RepID=A0A8S0Z1T4_ARCPL|nr:unnamed protein product [Arctia plantaginis]
MAPKKAPAVPDENEWRTIIEEAPLDEIDWSVKVILFEAAGSDQDRIYLTKFETFAAEEKRFVVKNICKTETVFMINQLGSEKKVKDDNLRVFEEGNSYLKEKKDIPADVMALIIKHLILKLKDEYLFIKRQRLEVKEGMQKESATMVNKAEVRGTVSAFLSAAAASEPPPTPTPKGAPVPSEVPALTEGKKYNTLLRERGEEWRDKVYVDDYPVDGPNLYVALTGFLEPYLPGCLVKIGIPLTAVVQIRIDQISTVIPSGLSRPTKRGQSQTELLAMHALQFWELLQLLRIQEESANDFKNTAFIVFSPPYWQMDELSGESDKIYDELCYLMYDIQDLSRQHIHYLENMDIINIPVHEDQNICNRYYHELIDDIPLESVTIYSILDCILATACIKQNNDSESSRSSLSTAITLNTPDNKSRAENLVKNVFSALCKTEETKKHYRLTYGEEYENHKEPIVIKYGDSAKYNTFHLGNLNLDKIVYTSLLGMPIHDLWLRQDRPTDELEAKVNFHVNVLLSCFEREDVETSELNRLLHILACRKLYNNRSSLTKRHLPPTSVSDFKTRYLKRSVLAKPLQICASLTLSNCMSPPYAAMTQSREESKSSYISDDPEVQRIKFLFDCPDISELVSAAEIAANQPFKHIIDDYDYFEDFTGISAFQIMREAFNKFNCVDYKYCEVTDCFILMFFNSHNKDGMARDEWRCHLSTPICLQDFFDYVLEEDYDWIQDEEKLYDKNVQMQELSESKHLIDPEALKSCVQYQDVSRDMLLEGSLKYNELVEAEESSHDSAEAIEPSSTKKTTTPGTSTDDQSSRKTKSSNYSPKTVKQSSELPVTESSTCIEIPKKPFLGYDLGDRRVEVFGKDSIYFSRDGTKISSSYSLIIPMNLEYIILNITPGNSYNEFWIHKALGEFVKPQIIDTCESFRISTKNQVLINLKKQSYTAPLRQSLVTDSMEKDIKTSKSSVNQVFEDKHFYSVFLTWPNGMITESVYEENSPVISHIKQYHVFGMPDLDEDMRCISLNGEVMIFKRAGEVEVLKPDGTYIKIKNCYKKPIVKERSDHSEVALGKGKRSKTKIKPSKVSMKSLKHVMSTNESITEEKVEYEMVIDEFEIINTNGFRQHFINDTYLTIEKLLIRTATDYCLGEIFSRRMDGTSILLNKDGILLVTFPNKTRIITQYIVDDEEIYPEWTDEEKEIFDLFATVVEDITSRGSEVSQRSYNESDTASSKKIEEEECKEKKRTDGYVCVHLIYTIEHANFCTVTIDKFNENISLDSPNGTTVVLDKNNHYNITLDPVTTAYFNGENLDISYEACPECKSFTTCNVKIRSTEINAGEYWVTANDSFGKNVIVNDEGSIVLLDELLSSERVSPEENLEETDQEPVARVITKENSDENVDDKTMDEKSESSTTSHGKCREMYLAKTLKFFILKRELTCSELIHRSLVEHYKRDCRWQPWCSINEYDSFGDNRSMVSILTPIHLTEAEKWLMDSKLADKPKYLTYKDLKVDEGKGYYHWMRPYERFVPKPMKPENVLPPRLPRAFVLRALEKQWQEPKREELKGARELLEAILKYRVKMEADSDSLLNVPIIDTRTEDEQRIDEMVQNLAHQIYEDLKERLNEDVQTRATLTITTKPIPPVPEEVSAEGEFEEEELAEPQDESNLVSDHSKVLSQVEQAEPMSPNLQKYWRRRAEERKEEEFFKYLLREGVVPPYFRNVLGGAIWWEMNNMTDEAVTKAERRKMTCVCAEDNKNVNPEMGPTGYILHLPPT